MHSQLSSGLDYLSDWFYQTCKYLLILRSFDVHSSVKSNSESSERENIKKKVKLNKLGSNPKI